MRQHTREVAAGTSRDSSAGLSSRRNPDAAVIVITAAAQGPFDFGLIPRTLCFHSGRSETARIKYGGDPKNRKRLHSANVTAAAGLRRYNCIYSYDKLTGRTAVEKATNLPDSRIINRKSIRNLPR